MPLPGCEPAKHVEGKYHFALQTKPLGQAQAVLELLARRLILGQKIPERAMSGCDLNADDVEPGVRRARNRLVQLGGSLRENFGPLLVTVSYLIEIVKTGQGLVEHIKVIVLNGPLPGRPDVRDVRADLGQRPLLLAA